MAIEQDFTQAIVDAGLPAPSEIIADGKLHRYKTSGRGRNSKNGWYIAYADGVPTIVFGCNKAWGPDVHRTWSAKPDRNLTPAEREANRERIRQAQAERAQEQAQRHAKARQAAEVELEASELASADHPYLASHEILPHGLTVDQHGNLLVPLYADGALQSIQRIAPSGEKRFLSGGRVGGAYTSIGLKDAGGKLALCGGFATGAAIHEATGLAVVIAFSAGNLLAVAQTIRAELPDMLILVAADDDWDRREGNIGIDKAKEAAQAVSGMLVVPPFPERVEGQTDFCDLRIYYGDALVKQAFDDALAQQPDAAPVQIDVAPAAPAARPEARVLLAHGKDLRPVPVSWIWKNWLARGKFHLLAGAPGQGKTTVTMAVAAVISCGGVFPGGERAAKGRALIWSGEDDPRDTLLPRFLACGGDPEWIHFVSGVAIGTEDRAFDVSKDMPLLERAIHDLGGVDLLVVDPVAGAITGDSHKNSESRRGLQPLADLAERTGCAVLGVTHFSKGGQGSDPAQRVIGSVAFTAMARVVWVAARTKSEDGEGKRILAIAKSNIGPDAGGFEYHLQQTEPLSGIEASSVLWGSKVEGTAQELLTDPDEDVEASHGTKDLPMLIWLELRDGMQPSKRVAASLKDAGFTEKEIRTARQKMNIRAKKSGMEGGWYWQLADGFTPEKTWLEEAEYVTKANINYAEDARRRPEDAHVSGRASSAPSGIFGGELNGGTVTNTDDEKGVVIQFKTPKTDAGKEVV